MSNTNNKKRTRVDTNSNIDITKIQTKKVKLEYKQEKKHNSDHIISTSNTNKQLKKMKYETICLPERQQDRNILNIDTKENRLDGEILTCKKNWRIYLYHIAWFIFPQTIYNI